MTSFTHFCDVIHSLLRHHICFRLPFDFAHGTLDSSVPWLSTRGRCHTERVAGGRCRSYSSCTARAAVNDRNKVRIPRSFKILFYIIIVRNSCCLPHCMLGYTPPLGPNHPPPPRGRHDPLGRHSPPLPRDGHRSGRYASYWNASLY